MVQEHNFEETRRSPTAVETTKRDRGRMRNKMCYHSNAYLSTRSCTLLRRRTDDKHIIQTSRGFFIARHSPPRSTAQIFVQIVPAPIYCPALNSLMTLFTEWNTLCGTPTRNRWLGGTRGILQIRTRVSVFSRPNLRLGNMMFGHRSRLKEANNTAVFSPPPHRSVTRLVSDLFLIAAKQALLVVRRTVKGETNKNYIVFLTNVRIHIIVLHRRSIHVPK